VKGEKSEKVTELEIQAAVVPLGLYPPLGTSMNAAAATPLYPLRPPLCGRASVECHISHAPGQTNSLMDLKI